jgi:anti-anti-sigma factor
MASASGSRSTPFEAYCDHGDPPTVYLSGEVDLSTHDRLAAVLDDAARPGRDLVLDCTKLTFIDVSGITVVERAARVLGDAQLRLKGVHGAVKVIIDVLDLTSTVPNLRQDTT